jgi:hypothetical protein
LSTSHIIKKLTDCIDLIKGWVLVWIWRKYRSRILAYALLVVTTLTFVSYFTISAIRSSDPRRAAPASGRLSVFDFSPYTQGSWAATLPLVSGILDSSPHQSVNLFTSETIGTLIRGTSHGAGALRIRFIDSIENYRLYLFIRQQGSDNVCNYVALQQLDRQRFFVPVGDASDRICGIVTRSGDSMSLATLKDKLNITLEAP